MKTRQIVCWLLCAASPALAQVSTWSSGTYAYDGTGNVKAIGADYYVYDQVGRLVRGSADKERSGVDNYQAYTYDAFGNRLTASTTGTQCVSGCGVNVQVNNANRVTDHSATYDAAGNLKHFDTSYYTYDGAGMLVTVSSSPTSANAEYIYTADDERLAIYTGGGNWRFTIRDLDAKVVREVTAFQSGGTTTWTWHRDHIFRDGLLLATVLPEGTQHYHLDHLGTPRLVTDGTGRKLGVHVYYPFGDELNLSLGELTSPERLKYTGHERDDGPNGMSLDYMHARSYEIGAGRFLSVDPGRDWDTRNPQSWNMYSYVGNNPINRRDPTGRYTCSGTKDECKAYEAGLSIVRAAAAEATRQKLEGADRLNKIVKLYGKPGEKNGVAVTFGATTLSQRMETTVSANGNVNIAVNRQIFAQDLAARQYVDIATGETHEGDHGLAGREHPELRNTNSRSILMQQEINAYRAGGYIYQSLGFSDTHRSIWQVDGGWTPLLEHFAKQSVEAECADRGGCAP